MKRLLSFLISMAIVLGTLPAVIVSAEVTSLNGSGTETSPYEISTAEELAFAVDMINNTDANTAHFKLLADIDYGEQEWEPIGSTSRSFKGVFDGNGKKITSLNVTCLDTAKTTFIYPRIGIFGKIEGAKVKNLGVDDFTVAVKNHDYYPNGANDSTGKFRTSNIGGFVSEAVNSVFENCYISNSSVRNLRRDCSDGGVAGFAAIASGSTSFKNCYVYNVDLCSGYGAPQAGFISNIVSATVKFENCYTADVEIVTTDASNPEHVSATYGFGYKRDTFDPTVTNCYTTLEDNEDVDGDYPDRTNTLTHDYTAAQSLLAETSNENEIIAGLITNDADTVYKTDANINGGYPYIDYNVVLATPTPTPAITPGGTPTELPEIKLVLMGDSLMDSVWNTSSYSWNKSGWEGAIGNHINNDKVSVVKHGHSGQTIQMFMNGRQSYHYCDWETIKTEFGAGDYVIIALGTNDNTRLNGTHATESYSVEQFKTWYKEIIADVRAKGAEILILTPPPTSTSISNGRFSGPNSWISTQALLALETEVDNLTVINIGEAYADTLNALINTGNYTAKDLVVQTDSNGNATGPGHIFVDYCHFTEYGADLLAWTIAKEISERTTGLEKYTVSKAMPAPGAMPTPGPTATPVPTPHPVPTPDASGWDGTPAADYAGGKGTKALPYLIENAAQLAHARDQINAGMDNGKHFRLTADIDLNYRSWVPISYTGAFSGTFDGAGYEVKHLCVETSSEVQYYYLGLFGHMSGTVKNLGINGAIIANRAVRNNNSSNRVTALGTIAGEVKGTIKNSYVTNTEVYQTMRDFGEKATGGFAGTAENGAKIENCYLYNAKVCSGQDAMQSGFIGCVSNADITIKNCYAAEVEEDTLCSHVISHRVNHAAFYGFTRAEGERATITNCYTTAENLEGNRTSGSGVYAPTKSRGTHATKLQIVSALVDENDEYCAWTVDESVNNGYPYHTFASMPDPDEVACTTDLAAITIESRVSSSFSVPTRGENGTSIEWASDDESAIVISDGTATVICDPDSEKTVKLTVAVSKGEFSVSKEITVVVEKLVAKYIKAGEKQSVTNPDGTVTVTLDVDYSGIRGQFETLTYMAVITDSTGRILQRVKDDASVETSGIGTASFEVKHREASANETVSYYLWGDDNISLLDNKPSAIKDFEAKSKVKGITLSWAQSYDDSGDPVKYKIYRNGTLIDTVMTNTYIAAGSDTESYSYKVVPVDTANKAGESKETAPMKLRQMFYNNPDSSWGINKTSVGGSDSYFANGAITIGDVTYSVYTSDISSRQHYIYFSRDMDVCDVTSADSDLVFEIDYYDKGAGALTMVYNSIVNGVDDHNVARKQILLPSRTNTETFKTAVIRISDAQLRESEHSSESSFGILIPKDTPANSIIIKEIRVCKAEDYE